MIVKAAVLLGTFFITALIQSCSPDGDGGGGGTDQDLRIPVKKVLKYATRTDQDSLLMVTTADSIFKIGVSGSGRAYTGPNPFGFTYFSTDNHSIVMVNPGGYLLRVNSDLSGVQRNFTSTHSKDYRLHHFITSSSITLLGYDCLNIDYNFTASTPGYPAKITTPGQTGNADVLGFAFGTGEDYIYYGQNGGYYVAKGTFADGFTKVVTVTKKTAPYLVKTANALLLGNTVIAGTSVFTQTLLEPGETFISGSIKTKNGEISVLVESGSEIVIKLVQETSSSVSLSSPKFTLNKSNYTFLSWNGTDVIYQDKSNLNLIIKTL